MLHLIEGKLPGYLREKGISEAYLIGSIIREGMFYPWSDVNIGVSSCPKRDYFRITSEIERMLDRDVLLIPTEENNWVKDLGKGAVRIL